MAQEQTVQGAAKKISGLLNPDKGQSDPEKKAEPSEQPEKIEQETSPESQPKSEGTPKEVVTENTEIKEETQTEIDEPELHRVKVQGQELEVTIDELKAGYSRDSDYRQKTHSLGLERKDLEGQKQSLRQTYDNRLSELNDMISTADGYIRQQQGSKDLQKLYDEDPTSAARLDYQLREQQKQIDGMKSKANEAYTKQYNEYLDAEKQLAAAKIPEFSDPNKSDHFKTKRPIVQKKVANAPKVVKSGVARSNVSSGRESIRNKIGTLKKTGHLKDAQNALMDMINLKSQQQRK